MILTRRTLLSGLAATAAASAFAAPKRAPEAAPGLRFGYAEITWGDNDRQALDDIAAVGFPGVQLRSNSLPHFTPAELRATLLAHKLTFVALSSGDMSLDKPEAEELARNVAHAQYLKDAGGLYLQILDSGAGKKGPRTVTPDECLRLGRLLTELGKRTAGIGVPLGYHNHMGTISEHPENLARVLDAADPKYVRLELDIAHSLQGGGDPIAQIHTYRDRLLFLHLKDVITLPPTAEGAAPGYRWVELGQGRVDVPGVFAALKKANFRGWCIVELDGVPVPSRTPRQSAEINRDFLTQKLGVRLPA